MSEIFGKTSRRESDNENPFVATQTREKKEEETEINEENLEQTQEQDEGQSVQSEPEVDEEVSNGQSDEEAQSNGKLAGKFNDRQSLLEGVKNLGSKIGRKVDPVKVGNATNSDLEEIYKDLESQLGQTSDIDKTRQENQQLKQQLNQYEQQLNQTRQQMSQMQRYLQNLQMNQQQRQQQSQSQQSFNPSQNQNVNQQNNQQLQRDPQTGRFQRSQNNQNNQDNQQSNDVDPDKWLRDFYKNPVEAIKKINNMSDRQQQQVKNNMNQQEIQQFQNQQREVQQQQQMQEAKRYRQQLNQESQQFFKQKRMELENKYEDFKDPEVKKDVVKYMQNHKAYLNPRIFPNGLEKAYLEVKKMRDNKQQAANQQETNDQMVKQKQAAQLPRSQGSNVRSPANENYAEQTKDRIFGGGGSIFGR
jgi:hypothetical protein